MELLILIVQDFKNIIECKKTDATTWREKDVAWKNVAKAFNSSSGEIFRSKKTLKGKYEDIKKNIKKKLAHNRMEHFKTGGGKPDIRPLTSLEETIISFLPSSIEGLPSVWDSDQSLAETCKENTNRKLHTEMHTEHSTDTTNTNDTNTYDTISTDDAIYIDMEMEQNNSLRSYDTDTNVELINELINENNQENEENEIPQNENINVKISKKRKNNLKDGGVSMLRKPITPELRVNKRLKKSHQIMQASERDQEMKEELHDMRMKILKKELEIKENNLLAELEINTERLKAAKLETEIKELHKQIKEAELRKLQKD